MFWDIQLSAWSDIMSDTLKVVQRDSGRMGKLWLNSLLSLRFPFIIYYFISCYLTKKKTNIEIKI